MVVLLLATAGVLQGVARVAGLPDGYNAAQSKDAAWLSRHPDRWAEWRDGATRDLLIFIPAFATFGLVALMWAMPTRSLRVWSCAFLAGVATSDVIETLLFRGSLDRFGDGVPTADLAARTTVTQVASGGKYLFLGLVGVTLGAVVLTGGRRNPG